MLSYLLHRPSPSRTGNHEDQGIRLGGFTEGPSVGSRGAFPECPTAALVDALSVFVQVLAVGFGFLEGHLDEQVNHLDYRVDAVVVARGNGLLELEEQIDQLVSRLRVPADYRGYDLLSASAR
jgi:hypothetical protein